MPTTKQINNAFKKKFRELDRATINTYGTAEQKLLASYTTALEDIKKQIADVYEKFGDNPSITQLRKFNRLGTIEKKLANRLNELNKEVRNITAKEIKTGVYYGYEATVNGINQTFGFNFTDTALDEKAADLFLKDNLWTDAMNNSTAELWSQTKRDFETVLRANAREEVLSGLAQGKSYSQVAKDIQARFDVGVNRAKKIAFTEMHKGHMYGRNAALETSINAGDELGIETVKVWRHNGAGKEPRENHIAADGQMADKDGFFFVGGEKLKAPGLGTDPANNIYCHCSAELELKEDVETEENLNEVLEDKGVTIDEDVGNYEKTFKKDFNFVRENDFFDEQFERLESGTAKAGSKFKYDLKSVKQDWAKKIKTPVLDEELLTVGSYTDEAYEPLNAFLNEGEKGLLDFGAAKVTKKGIKQMNTYSKNLSQVIDKLPNYKKDVMRYVYDTKTLPIKDFQNNIGKEFSWKGFASTSKNTYIPEHSAFDVELNKNQTFFLIKSKTGKDISWLSTFKKEQEVLFKPNTRFKILKVEVTNPFGMSNVKKVYLEEI